MKVKVTHKEWFARQTVRVFMTSVPSSPEGHGSLQVPVSDSNLHTKWMSVVCQVNSIHPNNSPSKTTTHPERQSTLNNN